MTRRAALLVALGIACAVSASLVPRRASAEGDQQTVDLDSTVVRFYAPEIGGATRPQFITQRVLSFQARLEAKAEDATSVAVQDRHVRAAVDRLVVEGILSALPFDRRPDARDIATAVATLRAGLAERIGGEAVIDRAGLDEGLSPAEIEAVFQRRARAALYADRALGVILSSTDEQLRDVFRTASHPFRTARFDEVRARFTSWFVDERLRVVEGAFLQAARSRIRVIPLRS